MQKLTAARVILSVAQRSRTAKQHRAKRGGISGENTLKFHYRSRFAPSLGSGSTTKISHREIFSAQDDTAGAKKYQISLFFRTVEDACPYMFVGIFRSSVLCALKPFSMKVFAELFSKSDHKNTSAYHSTNVERTMCAKTFQYESFLRHFFSKKWQIKIKKAYGKMPYAFLKNYSSTVVSPTKVLLTAFERFTVTITPSTLLPLIS